MLKNPLPINIFCQYLGQTLSTNENSFMLLSTIEKVSTINIDDTLLASHLFSREKITIEGLLFRPPGQELKHMKTNISVKKSRPAAN